jgi:VIT1/CCC1 family predicted Fe2+/Mn2+ transporter
VEMSRQEVLDIVVTLRMASERMLEAVRTYVVFLEQNTVALRADTRLEMLEQQLLETNELISMAANSFEAIYRRQATSAGE